jgi:hypothetical protein
MVRPRKENKEPMTSIAISEKLALELHRAKPFKRTIGDFVNILYGTYKENKEKMKDLQDDLANYKITNRLQEDQMKIKDRIIDEQKTVIEAMRKDMTELEKRLQIVQ